MIWLVGAGPMSLEYAKVLIAQGKSFQVVGRGSNSAQLFYEEIGVNVLTGGISEQLKSNKAPDMAIVAVGIPQLFETTKLLIQAGVSRILVEKPGASSYEEVTQLQKLAAANNAQVFIAYNRRFYSTVQELERRVGSRQNISSLRFEFTEWGHVIEKLNKPSEVLNMWFIANSTHVADLAYYLGGKPKKIHCYKAGSLSWHQSGSAYAGAGITESGVIFNYFADWASAGRWSIEVLTAESRFILSPLESLIEQKRGQLEQVRIDVDCTLDKDFKPGLYRQVEEFVGGKGTALCTLEEQVILFPTYEIMAGYQTESPHSERSR